MRIVPALKCELDDASDCTTIVSTEECNLRQLPAFFQCISLASPTSSPATEVGSDSFEISCDNVSLRIVPESSIAAWPVARLGQLRGRQRFKLFDRNGIQILIFQTCETVERMPSPRKSHKREETVQIKPTLIELVVTVDPAVRATWLHGRRVRPREPLTLAAIPMDQFRKQAKGKTFRVEVEGQLTRETECLVKFQHLRAQRNPKDALVTEKQRQDASVQAELDIGTKCQELCVISCGVRWDLNQVEQLRRIGVVVFTHPTLESYRRITVLVVQPPLQRSVKLFCAIPFLEHVVTPHWVEATLRGGCIAAFSDFPLSCDERSESSESRLRGFVVKACKLPSVSRQSLFRGRRFFVEREVQPQCPGNDIKDCISCSGGDVAQDRAASNVVVVPDGATSTTVIDAEATVRLEQIFTSILRQKLVWEFDRKRSRTNEEEIVAPEHAVSLNQK